MEKTSPQIRSPRYPAESGSRPGQPPEKSLVARKPVRPMSLLTALFCFDEQEAMDSWRNRVYSPNKEGGPGSAGSGTDSLRVNNVYHHTVRPSIQYVESHLRCDLFLIAHAGAAPFIPGKVNPAVFCRGAIYCAPGRDESRPYDAPLTSCTKMSIDSPNFGVDIFSHCSLPRYGRSSMKSAIGSSREYSRKTDINETVGLIFH